VVEVVVVVGGLVAVNVRWRAEGSGLKPVVVWAVVVVVVVIVEIMVVAVVNIVVV